MPKICVLGPFVSIFDQKMAKKEQTSEWHKIFASGWIFDLSQKSKPPFFTTQKKNSVEENRIGTHTRRKDLIVTFRSTNWATVDAVFESVDSIAQESFLLQTVLQRGLNWSKDSIALNFFESFELQYLIQLLSKILTSLKNHSSLDVHFTKSNLVNQNFGPSLTTIWKIYLDRGFILWRNSYHQTYYIPILHFLSHFIL